MPTPEEQLASLGITLHDHVIIARANYRSMRAMGLI